MQRYLTVWASLVALAILATSIYGGYLHFTPIPYWDQWDGYVGFYQRFQDSFATLWEQHGEHRLVVPRLIFLADIVAFGGNNVLTIVANYLLLGGLAVLLWTECRRGASQPVSAWFTGAVLLALMFSWVQHDNMTWGFQQQCILVYLFALAAAVQFSREDHRGLRIAAALALCLLSEVSMGNGMASFFALAVQAVVLRRPWREALIAVAAGLAGMAVYFTGYHFVKVDPVAGASAANIPLFFFVFLGAPVRWVTGSVAAAGVAGALSFGLMAYLTLRLYRARAVTSYHSILIAGYAFIVASAIAATKSRWMLGVPEAATSRYTTPVLLSFAILFLLVMDTVRVRRVAMLASVALITALVPYQRQIDTGLAKLFDFQLAVLGPKVGLYQPDVSGAVFPVAVHDRYLRYVDYAAATNFGPYATGWLHDAGIVKYDAALRDDGRCSGFLESVSPARTVGWIVPRQYENGPTLVVLADEAGKTVGYGVSGQARPDVDAAVPDADANAGWVGFVKPGAGKIEAFGYLGGKFCRLGTIGALAAGR